MLLELSLVRINVNLKIILFQAAMPFLKSSKGCIVNMVDVLGYRPSSKQLEYCVSKGGLIAATKSLSVAAGPEVRRLNLNFNRKLLRYELSCHFLVFVF